MKLNNNQTQNFLKSPDKNIPIIIIFGPDDGLCKEYVSLLIKQFNFNIDDPFQTSIISSDDFESYPNKLLDEASTISFFNEKKLVLYKSIGDLSKSTLNHITLNLKNLLNEHKIINNIVMLELGNIKSSSDLIKIVNASKSCVSIACYNDSVSDLSKVIELNLKEQNISIDKEALEFFIINSGNDRKNTLKELDKIFSYIFPKNNISFDDINNCLSNNNLVSIEDIAFSAIFNNHKQLVFQIESVLSSGVHPIFVLKNIINVLNIIFDSRNYVDNGDSISDALNKSSKYIFWKSRDNYIKSIKYWSTDKVGIVLNKLISIEEKLKLFSNNGNIILIQTLLNFSKIRG